MPTVVINEFELIPAPPPEIAAAAGAETLAADAQSSGAAPAQSRVQETERLICRQAERALRIWAH